MNQAFHIFQLTEEEVQKIASSSYGPHQHNFEELIIWSVLISASILFSISSCAKRQ